jgi:hypothetical protein
VTASIFTQSDDERGCAAKEPCTALNRAGQGIFLLIILYSSTTRSSLLFLIFNFYHIDEIMAEALAVVGVVASIVQLVDFSSKVLHRLNEFQSSLGEVPKAFQHVKAELPILLETLKQTESSIQSQSLGADTKQAISLIISRCQTQIALLNELVEKVLPKKNDSWSTKTSKAFFSLRQDAKVVKITTNLRIHIQSLANYKVATLTATKGMIHQLSKSTETCLSN